MTIGDLNLDIRISDCSSSRNLSIKDESFYLETPVSPRVVITMPGTCLTYAFDFVPSRINIYNSYSLGISASNETHCLVDLPDGLYKIQYMICPYDKLITTVYHIRQVCAWNRWEACLTHLFDSCLDISSKIEKELNKIEYLLKGATAFANSCNSEKSIELHQKAMELLKELECIL